MGSVSTWGTGNQDRRGYPSRVALSGADPHACAEPARLAWGDTPSAHDFRASQTWLDFGVFQVDLKTLKGSFIVKRN